MNQLEERIRRELHAAGERIPHSPLPAVGERASEHRPWLPAPVVGIVALVAALVVVGGISMVLLGPADGQPESPAAAATAAEPAVAGDNSVVAGTQPNGSTGPCNASVTRSTMYLGGPPWEGNLAAAGFIFALPDGPSAPDVAGSFVSQAVIGAGCEQQIGISSQSDIGGGRTSVGVEVAPPATTSDLRLVVDVGNAEGVVGVTGVRGATSFEVVTAGEAPALRLAGALPADADRLSVRFRKGDDVWELSLAAGETMVALEVPSGEVDRFPDAEPDWILFTASDRNGNVVDVGGTMIP